MKTIFLIMKYYSKLDSHTPFPKFDYQIEALVSMEIEVSYLMIENHKIYICNNDSREFILEFKPINIPVISVLTVYHNIYKAAIEVFKKGYSFDLVYIRYMPITHLFKKALKKMKDAKCRIVVEIPTHPIQKEINEEKRISRRVFFKMSKLYFDTLGKYIDLFALIGEESSQYLNKPAINIENGISLSMIPKRTPKFTTDEIHILCLANMAKWHGYDRLIEGLKIYYDNRNDLRVILYIVGSDGDGSGNKWREMAKTYKLEEYIHFEGPKYGKELNWYFDNCQLAVGSIGLHRIGYKSAATLKVREYMARGVPFILSATDQSINKDDIFYLEVPEDDTPINIEVLISEILAIKDWNQISNKMRDYVAENMTWNRQFLKIFSYFLRKD